jgi:S1-C subfamily serine protease
VEEAGVGRWVGAKSGYSSPDTVPGRTGIHPDNSGGPLVSMDGAVVGVNRARGGENVGFAISTAIVKRVVPALIRRGSYAHSYVGILSVEVTPAVAEANDLSTVTGLHVVDTPAGGPAEGVLQGADSQTLVDGRTVRTGGDVILAIDGQSIQSHQDLARYLALQTSPGQTVTFTVLRNGTRQSVELTLGERPEP